MTDKRKWHKGPPPHVGWWNASAFRSPNIWRWWDGHRWSLSVSSGRSADEAGRQASQKSDSMTVKWTDYWPENARVPRIAP